MHQVPSLVDLCVQVAKDNLRYLGDVGETDYHLLDRIFNNCSCEQLMHIEDSTKDRDLSPITDKFWKKFYGDRFGSESTNIIIERMRQRKVSFKWKQLYEAKLKERDEAVQKSLDRMKSRYQEEHARKQSRQVQLCSKVPPSSRKRSFCGGAIANNIYNTKSGLMKKAKLDFVNSREFKNMAAMKNKVVHRNHSVPSMGKTSTTSGLAPSSSSKQTKPLQRR